MNTNDTCTVTLTLEQAKLVRYALLRHWEFIDNDEGCSAEKKAAALANIDAAFDQLGRFIAAAQKVAA